jgi:hypothetical protein
MNMASSKNASATIDDEYKFKVVGLLNFLNRSKIVCSIVSKYC